jgi:hypothetical protein
MFWVILGSNPGKSKILFSKMSTLALWPQPASYSMGTGGGSFPGVMQLECDDDNSSPSIVAIKE